MPDLVKAHYQDLAVAFTDEGWFNATTVAERFGKRVNDFLSLPTTKEYIAALNDHADSNTGFSGISKVGESHIWFKAKRGNNGGTWMHPDLAVRFAQWIDVRFAIWCDRQIRQIVAGTHPHYDWKRLRHEATASCSLSTPAGTPARSTSKRSSAKSPASSFPRCSRRRSNRRSPAGGRR